MLTYQDCLGLCDFTEEEIRAIAEHEHVPEIIALELGEYLVHMPDGEARIRRIILDDMAEAERTGDTERHERLRLILMHFIATHPQHSPGRAAS